MLQPRLSLLPLIEAEKRAALVALKPKEPERCGTCQFHWSHGMTVGSFMCKRRAPMPFADHLGTRWPITNVDDWCGEFVRKARVVS